MQRYIYICKKLKINYKKDLTILSIIVILLLLFSVFITLKVSSIVGIISFVFIFIYVFFHLSSLLDSYKQLIYAKEIAFNGFYRYVITLINNKHILYSALQASLEYVDEVLLEDVNELINDIENDPSLEPFFKFMDNFEDETIKQMIVLLYKTQEVNMISQVLENINNTIVNIQDTSITKYIAKEEKSIEKYHMIPIVLSAVALIIVAMFIFKIIGEGTYV